MQIVCLDSAFIKRHLEPYVTIMDLVMVSFIIYIINVFSNIMSMKFLDCTIYMFPRKFLNIWNPQKAQSHLVFQLSADCFDDRSYTNALYVSFLCLVFYYSNVAFIPYFKGLLCILILCSAEHYYNIFKLISL